MKTAAKLILTVIAASLVFSGCYDNPTSYPPVDGFQGTIDLGWENFHNGDYEAALGFFQQAIDMNVSHPAGYLGAAWTTVFLPDYWNNTGNYAYMACQLADGTWPLEIKSEQQVQDMYWTTFECTYPVLTDNDIQVIQSYGDSLLVIEGDTLCPRFVPDTILAVENFIIGDWFYDTYYDQPDSIRIRRWQYKFEIDDPNVGSIFFVNNAFASTTCHVDSIQNGTESTTVWISVPHSAVNLAGTDYETWCMYDNIMEYEYSTYSNPGGNDQMPLDALVAYGMLQDARTKNGNGLFGAAALLGAAESGDYSFEHFTSLDPLKLKGTAAAIAYRNESYRFALSICRDSGYALDILPSDHDFMFKLAQEIQAMLTD